MSNTLDLNVANLREIAIFFGVTNEVAKAIDAGAPSSLSQLISISGFPSTFFESNTTCNVIFMENTKSSEKFHDEQSKEGTNANWGQKPPPVSENDLHELLRSMQINQDRLAQKLDQSELEVTSLKNYLTGISTQVSKTCTEIKHSVDQLQSSFGNPSQSTDGIDRQGQIKDNCHRQQAIPGDNSQLKTDSNLGSDIQNGENSDSQFAALSQNVAQLITAHEQTDSGSRRQLPNPRRTQEYRQGRDKPNTNHGAPRNKSEANLTSVNLLKQIKLPKFTGAGGVSWDAFISVLESRASRHKCNEADRLELLEGSLDGEAFQYYGDLPDRDLKSYDDLRQGLEQRFGRTVSSKARRAELHSMQQDPGEDLYRFSSRIAKVATEGYPNIPLDTRSEMEVDTFFRGCSDQEQAAWLIHHKFQTLNSACNAMHTAQQNTKFLAQNKSVKAVRFAEKSETEEQQQIEAAAVCRTSLAESSIDKLCRDVHFIRQDVSAIKSTRRTGPGSDSRNKEYSLARKDAYRGRSPSPANRYPSYDSRGRSPPPVHRSNELPWSNDRRQSSHQNNRQYDARPDSYHRFHRSESPFKGREGQTGSPYPSYQEHPGNGREEQRSNSFPKNRSQDQYNKSFSRQGAPDRNQNDRFVRHLGINDSDGTSQNNNDDVMKTHDSYYEREDQFSDDENMALNG